MEVPRITTVTMAAAASGAGHYDFDMRGANIASLQINATLSGTDTDAITLQISNDGVNFVGFSTAKTVTFTGGGTVNALFELGTIDYVWLRVSYGAPSADTVTLVGILYATASITRDA